MTAVNFSLAPISRFLNPKLRYLVLFLTTLLAVVSVFFFVFYLQSGLGLAYNDARSHLNIGRRVVEGLKPGLAQLGSVWLPLTHLLMVLTIWNDFMWHTGLAGALQSMLGFVATSLLIYKFLEQVRVGWLGRVVGTAVFAANLNVLYLQSTAMTELPLLATMTAGCYFFLRWFQTDHLLDIVKSAFFVMLSTLIRYDGWFLLTVCGVILFFAVWKKRGWSAAEGTSLLFGTLAGFGVAFWFLWNQLIFKDALYFAFGPFSARSQQAQLEAAGVLQTRYNFSLSTTTYFYALLYNSYTFPAILALFGLAVFLSDKKLPPSHRLASLTLLTPLAFNILALYLGHSVLFVQGISGDTWFNIRYGVMVLPAIAFLVGFLVDRAKSLRPALVGLTALVYFFAFTTSDAVTIDDARVGSSQKNVSEVANYLARNAKNEKGFILVSAASHDAIIFSSGLPMKRFIHEGTGAYWEAATTVPDHWARWIIMRTYDDKDLTWKFVSRTPGFARYNLAGHFPFVDIYELKPEYIGQLHTTPIFPRQK